MRSTEQPFDLPEHVEQEIDQIDERLRDLDQLTGYLLERRSEIIQQHAPDE